MRIAMRNRDRNKMLCPFGTFSKIAINGHGMWRESARRVYFLVEEVVRWWVEGDILPCTLVLMLSLCNDEQYGMYWFIRAWSLLPRGGVCLGRCELYRWAQHQKVGLHTWQWLQLTMVGSQLSCMNIHPFSNPQGQYGVLVWHVRRTDAVSVGRNPTSTNNAMIIGM